MVNVINSYMMSLSGMMNPLLIPKAIFLLLIRNLWVHLKLNETMNNLQRYRISYKH